MIVIGDTHGKWTKLLYYFTEIKLTNTNFIHVGDFGIGFYPSDFENLTYINKYLSSNNNNLYVIRGNHDNPMYFNNCKPNYSHIHLLSDWSYHTIEEKKGLFIGGAISIDRNDRTVNHDYWLNEGVSKPPENFLFQEVDFIISHNCPLEINPIMNFNNDIFKENKELYNDCLQDRKILSWVWKHIPKAKLQKWCYGHYHWSENTYIDNTHFILLDVFEFKELYFKI